MKVFSNKNAKNNHFSAYSLIKLIEIMGSELQIKTFIPTFAARL